MKKSLLLVMLCLFIFAVSCNKGGGSKTGDYVINIDGTRLTKEDVNNEMKGVPPMARQFFAGPEGMTRFVDELVKKEILYLEAKKRKLDQDKDFQKKVEEFKKITLINQLLEKEIEAASKVSDKDIKDFYDSHKAEFTMYNQVKISQILLQSEADAKKAEERLKAGEDFAKVASSMSVDKKSAKSGGDLGSFKKGQLSPELEESVFRLKKGEVSEPVKLKDGIHIFKLNDAQGTVIEFDKIKNMIGQKVMQEKQKTAFDKLIENLKKSYKIEINKDAVAKLGQEQPSAPDQGIPGMPGAQPQAPKTK